MTENPVRPNIVVRPLALRLGLVFLGCAAILLSGCSMRKTPSVAWNWNTAILARPLTPPRSAVATDLTEDPVPELQQEAPPFPLQLISTRSAPARPHVSAPASNDAGTDAEKPESPLIAPSLSAQETAVAQQQTNESLNTAEKNLAATRGKNLNAAQSDLVSKILGFMKDAREAEQIADWARARSLAKKAQVLSEELARSF
jgi:hypothetical protein